MRINSFHAIARATVSLACILLMAGCGGGDDASVADSSSGESSASKDAVAADVESRMSGGGGGAGENSGSEMGMEMGMGMEGSSDGGSSPPGGGTGGDEMAMMNEGGYVGSEGGEGGEMDENMYAAYGAEGGEGGYGGGAGNGRYGAQNGAANNLPSRPADVNQWTSEHMLAAVDEKDSRVLQAIQAKAATSQGDPAFAQLMTQVLQKSAGEQVGAASAMGVPGGGGTGLGIPGLGSFFGGGGGGNNAPAQPSAPKIVPGSVPPGGAFYRPNLIPSPATGIDSLELMIGEAVLTYAPQAVQSTRGAAQRLQGSASGNGAQPAGGGSSATGSTPPQSYPAGGPPNGGPGAAGSAGYEAMNVGEGAEYQSGEGMEDVGYPGGGIGGAQRPAGNLQNEELVRTVVRALVTNNTPPSWDALKSIVNGKVLTPLPIPTSTQIILAEVFSAEKPNLQVASELLTQATKAVVTNPAENQETMRFLAALAQNPTDHFLMLNKPMAPVAAPAPGPGGLQPGMNPNGAAMAAAGSGIPGQPNPAAMAGGGPASGYPGGEMPGEMAGEGNYENGSGAYGGPPGGRPPGPQPGALPPVRVSEAGMSTVAQVLWNKQSTDAIAAQLTAADSPASVADTLALASTIPSDSVRHATFSLFEKAHAQGISGMAASGLFRDVARDPGLLAVLKALPRKRPVKKPASANINAPAPPPDPAESWVAATQDVVLSLRDRLRDVADNPELNYTGQQRLRLHRDAVPESSIMIKAPGKVAEELGDAAPAATTMYYTACRITPQRPSEMQVVVDHYEKRSKGMKREDRTKGILWYDGVKLNGNGTRETTDVIISQVGFRPQANAGFGGGGGGAYEEGGGGGAYGGGPGGGGGAAAGGPPQFTIEVIVVITNDPKKASSAAPVSTAAAR